MNPDIEYDWAAHDARIRMHYDHAREKHPYFCDKTESPVCIDHLEYLNFLREHIGEQMKRNSLNWHTC